MQLTLQPIEALRRTENFLKVPLRGTFKKFSVLRIKRLSTSKSMEQKQ